MDTCAAETFTMLSQDPFVTQCLPKYSDADKAKFENYGQLAAGVKCFLENFHKSCSSFVYDSMMALAEQANTSQATGK